MGKQQAQKSPRNRPNPPQTPTSQPVWPLPNSENHDGAITTTPSAKVSSPPRTPSSKEFFAGSTFGQSPSPASLPVPSFMTRSPSFARDQEEQRDSIYPSSGSEVSDYETRASDIGSPPLSTSTATTPARCADSIYHRQASPLDFLFDASRRQSRPGISIEELDGGIPHFSPHLRRSQASLGPPRSASNTPDRSVDLKKALFGFSSATSNSTTIATAAAVSATPTTARAAALTPANTPDRLHWQSIYGTGNIKVAPA